MDFKKDYYHILGVPKTASKEEMRAAYRKLAKLCHPDKNPGFANNDEKFKLVNEANEILTNEITRHVYDEYKRHEEQLNTESIEADQVNSTNKKTYYRTETIRREKRIYIKGWIVVKFWGEQLSKSAINFVGESDYKIHPTDINVIVDHTDIHPLINIPSHYQKSFKESELFSTPLQQPIKCIIRNASGEEHFNLTIYDIRVKDPTITNVTKHESESFGTLEGTLYGYVLEIEVENIQVPVTECYGSTGGTEFKDELGSKFIRKEFYYKDCTTFWGPWEKITDPIPRWERTQRDGRTPIAQEGCLDSLGGCLQWWWIPLSIALLIAFPKFILAILAIVAVGFIFSLFTKFLAFFGRFLPWLILLFYFILIAFAIRSCSSKTRPYVKHDTPSYDTLTTSTVPTRTTPPETMTGDTTKVPDTLISHYIEWKDYDSTKFNVRLTISSNDLRNSENAHNNYSPYDLSSLGPVYNYLIHVDDQKMFRIYNAFDSIRMNRQLNDVHFARMIFSCIQSIPFYLVVDRSCSDNYYEDEYVQNYLSSCNRDCCIGFARYGVRSPVEFLGDLKGDCDTRSTLLYTILKHYNYNVALLTSNYYKHALLAVNIKDYKPSEGVALNIHDRNYYLWETTSAGFDIGIIPTYLQNLNYWDISLLNENY
jgi:hypothetical protein